MSESGKKKRWLLDYEVEKASNGVFKASTLRKDRVTAQRFPFHRVNDSVFYDLDELNATLEAARFGGKPASRGKQGRAKVPA